MEFLAVVEDPVPPCQTAQFAGPAQDAGSSVVDIPQIIVAASCLVLVVVLLAAFLVGSLDR